MLQSLKNLISIKNPVLLTQMLDKEPNMFIRPIALGIGFIMNLVFQLLYGPVPGLALGLSIIVLTIIVRTLMLPLGFKQQQSTRSMQKLQPQIKKIQDKYGDTKDPEKIRKRDTEIMALQSKSGVSMLGGCLPLLITMPLFFALSLVMRTTYEYIPQAEEIYEKISITIQDIPDYTEVIYPIALPMVPKGRIIDFGEVAGMKEFVNRFSEENWDTIISQAGPKKNELVDLLAEKKEFESFLGMNLIEQPKLFKFPGFLIPLISGITQFLSFYFMEKQNPPAAQAASAPEGMDPAQMNKMMKWVMPFFMVYMTTKVSAGVGLYWSVSNVYSVLQQIIIAKFYDNKEKKDTLEAV